MHTVPIVAQSHRPEAKKAFRPIISRLSANGKTIVDTVQFADPIILAVIAIVSQ